MVRAKSSRRLPVPGAAGDQHQQPQGRISRTAVVAAVLGEGGQIRRAVGHSHGRAVDRTDQRPAPPRAGSADAGASGATECSNRTSLGVDGTASNESGELHTELRNALLINRIGVHHEAALNARQALRLGTYGGAQVLGRAAEIGSLEPGKLADLVLWKMDTLAHASIADPVIALVFGAAAPVTLSLVHGRTVVEDNYLTTVEEDAIARSTRAEARRLARIAAQD
jgi:hypothetical protein